MTFKTIKSLDSTIGLKGKIILLREDLNVPAKDGVITDFTRIDRAKPTIDALRKAGAKIVVLAHYGRPDGEVKADYSMEFITPALATHWDCPVAFCAHTIGTAAQNAVSELKDGDVLLLENVRFHAGEEKNDPAFTASLAQLGDVFINDAFSAAHRAHASTCGLADYLPTAAGLLMEAELNALSAALENPQRPVMAIVGGAKVSSKLSVLNNLVKKADYLVLGGGMANTFLYANGIGVGQSLCEKDMADTARTIIETAKAHNCQIILPSDRIVISEFRAHAPNETVPVTAVPEDKEAVDIGAQTIADVTALLQNTKTVLWNGPMGIFEVKPFDNGTNGLAQAVAALTKAGKITSVAGGGDTVSALENAGVVNDFTYISTAGGAFLEWMEGKDLPGVAALKQAYQKAA